MSAHDQMRAMLDQLMGTGRNGETSRYQVQFNDPKVCKSFLLYCCPHDILASTVHILYRMNYLYFTISIDQAELRTKLFKLFSCKFFYQTFYELKKIAYRHILFK
ncbi:PREDICTED: putative RNA-binding protein Luc7-like 2 [Diuraphis noxia]|uniref:putative RNA-binding protein Luc7-like 2 n=1 Tax=Diuraphis noxia TaxID=143948 RepID=UPI000763689F|nr:PREDICTED: putative RNA-binding protein Luc7-like 2 [Diuraphis noxia]